MRIFTLLLLVLAPLQMSAAVPPCASPKNALETANWDQFRSVPSGTVTVFTTLFRWQGLDQVFPTSVATEQHWKAFLPWGVPTTVAAAHP